MGKPWKTMGKPWKTLENYGKLWENHGKPWNNYENKMQPTNPNAHTYVNGTDVKAYGYAVTHNAFLQ